MLDAWACMSSLCRCMHAWVHRAFNRRREMKMKGDAGWKEHVLGVLIGLGEGGGQLHELVESHRTIGARVRTRLSLSCCHAPGLALLWCGVALWCCCCRRRRWKGTSSSCSGCCSARLGSTCRRRVISGTHEETCGLMVLLVFGAKRRMERPKRRTRFL